ncbi:MAG: hypothetical protein M3Q09_00935 [Gemmatimonadota bacterium]|nr:hypothetical protein [Gemmatimonadota bacterium]
MRIRRFNFFPLYPALSRLLGGKGHANLAGIFLSQVLTLGSLILMSLLAHGARRGRLVEEPGVWLLLNPFSFFLLTFYAESLFLFLTLCTSRRIGGTDRRPQLRQGCSRD